MDSIRQQKISKLLQKEFSKLLLKEIKHLCGKAFVTVTMVRVTSDLGIARFYLSVFATEDKEAFINNFTENSAEVRFLLGKKLRNNLRHIPEIHFYIDDSLDYIEKINNALKK